MVTKEQTAWRSPLRLEARADTKPSGRELACTARGTDCTRSISGRDKETGQGEEICSLLRPLAILRKLDLRRKDQRERRNKKDVLM